MLKKIVLLWMFLGTLGMTVVRGEEEQGIRFLDNVAWKQVVEKAVEQKRMVFVDCYTSWCGPCKMLAMKVFSLKEVGDFFNSTFVNVKYDMEKPEGVIFGKKYPDEVKNYPTMLVIDPQSGKILYKFVGFRSAEELIFEAKQGLKKKGEVSLDERYASGERDYLFIKDYVLSLSLSKQKERIVEVIDDYFRENAALDELLTDEEKWSFFSTYLYDVRSELVQFVIRNYNQLTRKEFVDRQELKQAIVTCMYDGLRALLKMDLEGGILTPFKADPEFREMFRRDLKMLPGIDGRENYVAILKLYDRLVAHEWRGAYELLTYMRLFEMNRVLRGQIYQNVCVYLAERSGDRQLTEEILADLQKYQAAGGNGRMADFNIYDYIAFVQERLGDYAAAKESMKKYEEMKLAWESRFKQDKPRPKKR